MANSGAAKKPRPDPTSLLNAVKQLHLEREYSDLTIKCEGREWPLNKAIICTQSSFFASACKKGWQESSSGIITLEDERWEMVRAMIDYFYLSSYDEEKIIAEGSDLGPLQFNVKMFTAADKFDINGLGDIALEKFNTLVEVPSLLPAHDFVSSTYEVYNNAPNLAIPMRKAMVTKTISESRTLFNKTSDNLASSSDFQKVVEELPVFGAEIIGALTAQMEEKKAEMEDMKKAFAGSDVCHCPLCDVDFKVTGARGDKKLFCPCCKKAAIRFWT